MYRYSVEFGFGALVAVTSWKMISVLETAPADAFTTYQSLMIVSILLLLFVATVIMSNSARTRVAAEHLADKAGAV